MAAAASATASAAARPRPAARGITVGPRNLPDGYHKQRVQSIKRHLVQKAKVKSAYARIKHREAAEAPAETPAAPDAGPQLHPARRSLMEQGPATPDAGPAGPDGQRERSARHDSRGQPRPPPPRSQPFRSELAEAGRRREEREARQKARAEAEETRQRKILERDKYQRAMTKARRVGPNGQRKLGRESTLLLEKVRKLVGAQE